MSRCQIPDLVGDDGLEPLERKLLSLKCLQKVLCPSWDTEESITN